MIVFVLGTRPEVIKLYSMIDRCYTNKIDYTVIATWQHYDSNMFTDFFVELWLQPPMYVSDEYKNIYNFWLVLYESIKWCDIDYIVTQGDTDSAFIGGHIGKKLWVKVVHIEAGLRSNDMRMPEEQNRRMLDHIADYLFCPTQNQFLQLIKEGVMGKAWISWNTICDTIKSIPSIQPNYENYVLLTLHRPENVDNKDTLIDILESVKRLDKNIVFPIHPRTEKKMKEFSIYDDYKDWYIPLLWYKESINMIRYADMVLTDSWGIQEEAYILGRKCIVLRDNTERPEVLGDNCMLWCKDLRNTVQRVKTKTIYSNVLNPNNSDNIGGDIIEYLVREKKNIWK